MQPFVIPNTIFMTIAGSHMYGMATAASDIDKRGVCVPPYTHTLGFHNFEQQEVPGEDTVIFSLKKFMHLASDCNPNIIELLYAPDDCIQICEPLWKELLEHRDKFLSTKAYHTFCGYAHGQLTHVRNHRAWLTGPPTHKPTREEFGLQEHGVGARELAKGIDISQIDPGVQDLINRERKYKAALAHYNQYENWKATRNPKRAELEAKYGFDCYSSDTEFLTHNGWKKFDEITQEDSLATVFVNRSQYEMSHRTELGIEYQRYTHRFDADFSGEMFHLDGNHIDVCVTPNHRMLFKPLQRRKLALNEENQNDWVLEEAAHLPDTFEILSTPTPETKTYKLPEIVTSTSLTPMQLMRVIGWYLSDGTINGGDTPKAVRISQKKGGKLHWSLSRFYGEVKEKIPIGWYEYLREKNELRAQEMTEIVMDIRDSKIIDLIVEHCGRRDKKRIPRWVYSLSKRLKEALLDAALGGDGTTRNTSLKSAVYYSSVRPLADDIQELAFLCGYETSLYGPYENKEYKSYMYHVHINKTATQTKTMRRNNNVKTISVTKQRVVCFSVPNGTLVTRRNGHIAIHGNCKHASHLIRLLRMSLEILSEGKVIVRRPDAAELLAIRQGAWTYDQLMEQVEKLRAKVDAIYESKTYVIPVRPDVNALSDLCANLHLKYYGLAT